MPDFDYLVQGPTNSPAPFNAALLPPEARRRLQILRDAHRDSTAMSGGLGFGQIQLNDQRQSVSASIRLLESQRAGADHPEMVRLKALLREIDEQRASLDERMNLHHAATAHRVDLLKSVEGWLRINHARYGFAQVRVQVRLQKGESDQAAVERLRLRLRELNSEKARVEAAIYPLATAVQVAKDWVASRARPPIASNCLEHAGPLIINGRVVEPAIVMPTMTLTADVATAQGSGGATGVIEDHVGFACWLAPEAIVAKITEDLLRPDSDEADALDANQRRIKLETIERDRLVLEAEECELLFKSLAAGVVIEARADCSPQAFLGLALVAKAPEPAADDVFSRGRRAQGRIEHADEAHRATKALIDATTPVVATPPAS